MPIDIAKSHEAQRHSRDMREEYSLKIYRGECTFKEVVKLSWMDEYRYLGKMRLKDLLVQMPGWEEAEAVEAMIHFGFGIRDKIEQIRRNRVKVDNFSMLLKTTGTSWKPKPEMPEGYPFFGKITHILSMNASDGIDIYIPDEIVHLTPKPDNEDMDTRRFASDDENEEIRMIMESSIPDDDEFELDDLIDDEDEDGII